MNTRQEPRVVVYSKDGCHLCESAETTIEEVCADLDIGWMRHDISSDQSLMAQYGDQLPVTFVDGKQHDFWRVQAQRLRTALKNV